MNPQDENIQFDEMPDWGGMFPPQVKQRPIVEEKEYSSLYEELEDKCNPALFAGTDNFEKANQLYVEIKDPNNRNNERTLISIRNRVIIALNVHFSTKKKYDYLKKYFDVNQYTQMEPYDAQRVAKANEYYTRLQQDKDNIMALDQLESDAKEFIDKRNKELEPTNSSVREVPSSVFYPNTTAPDPGGDNPHDDPATFILVSLSVLLLFVIMIVLISIKF